jgi:hypothetical protein
MIIGKAQRTLVRLRDVVISRRMPSSLSVARAELMTNHRVRERQFLLDALPPNSIGAELGVFTGLFSSVLARSHKFSLVTFVDPWWTIFGDYYPDWGMYTDYGRLKTRHAYKMAVARISRYRNLNRNVEVTTSTDWLSAQPDESLDWVYLDSTHDYDGTRAELQLLDRKIRSRGMIVGDDWKPDISHHHNGVFRAVQEFLKSSEFEIVTCGVADQWVLRRARS